VILHGVFQKILLGALIWHLFTSHLGSVLEIFFYKCGKMIRAFI